MSVSETVVDQIEGIASLKRDEPLARHTTFGIGGPADVFVTVETAAQLGEVVRACQDSETPFFVLGSGSNIVVGDAGIRGVTIENKASAASEPVRMPRVSTRGDDACLGVRADAGCSFAALARRLSFAGYAGLEWASGIPGSVGGAVVYNAGAYGGCLADVLTRIGVQDTDGVGEIAASDLGLVYRGSDFTRGLMAGRAVLWAEFALWPGDAAALRERVKEFDERRLKAQPRGRNAGSIFKNPAERPAWRLIDEAGLRGHRIGGAEFSPKHSNFIVNAGGARAADVAALIDLAQTRVRDQFGVELEAEVSLVGEGF